MEQAPSILRSTLIRPFDQQEYIKLVKSRFILIQNRKYTIILATDTAILEISQGKAFPFPKNNLDIINQ